MSDLHGGHAGLALFLTRERVISQDNPEEDLACAI